MNIDYLMIRRLRMKEIINHLNYDDMIDNLYEMENACTDIEMVDDEVVLSAIDDNEELLESYKLTFNEIGIKIHNLFSDINDTRISEYCDNCIDAIMEFENFEKSKLFRSTKAEIMFSLTSTLNFIIRYCEIVADYRNLEGIYNMICEKDNQISKAIKEINELYEKISDGTANSKENAHFDILTETLPQEVWIR